MKIKKKMLSLVAVGALGLSAVIPAAHAAESEAGITFTSPNTAPDILNPDNPNEEADDDQINEGEITNEVGVLTLDFVSNLEFGEHELSLTTDLFPAVNETTPFAQVTDLRGTGEGWELRAELGDFTNEFGNVTLPGASINLNEGAASANTATEGLSDAPDVNSGITLVSGGETTNVTTATPSTTEENDQGMGTWLTTWNQNNINLDIPDTVATEGSHTATITWTLHDAPSGGSIVQNDTADDTPTP